MIKSFMSKFYLVEKKMKDCQNGQGIVFDALQIKIFVSPTRIWIFKK